MTFWIGVLAGFLANVFAGVLLVIVYVVIQWFLAATDITIGYNWRFDGTVVVQFDGGLGSGTTSSDSTNSSSGLEFCARKNAPVR